MKTDEHYKKEIAVEIRRIMKIEGNEKAATEFRETLGKIKPKTCRVKIGWKSGHGISFTLGFEKGDDKNPFDLFIENIKDSAEIHGFICGLYPDIFHFDPIRTVNDEKIMIVNFKLKRHG